MLPRLALQYEGSSINRASLVLSNLRFLDTVKCTVTFAHIFEIDHEVAFIAPKTTDIAKNLQASTF